MFKLSVAILVVSAFCMCTSERKRRSVIGLLDTIDDYCEGEETCNDDIMDDLIWYLSGEPYDDELDAGTSRSTVLLESIDDKCDNDGSCLEPLLEILTDRVLDDPMM